ncbi:SPOR domain-containing protein [Ramlibacter sp. PS4R-6]|uniref:SPOR domain-containing protein n=1 Tax=Ramlibacter sp. PS4R-6 TaxID=3133438 RepID=UPI0030ACD2C6
MAFFQSRKGGDDTGATARQPESIEAMRKRAKHRLIGACVLVLIGVVGFPLLFDTQPRPISVDIPIEIPDRKKVKPLTVPAAPVTQSAPAAQPPSAAGAVTQAPVTAPAPPPAPVASVAKAEPAPAPKPEPKQEAKAPADDGTKAAALLEGKPVASTPVISEGRYVVQVGAFSDVTKARETRLKLEHAGLKTYTQVVETKDGKRIRVRLGPFATKADAEKAAERVKGLDLQPAVLTL